MRTGPVSTIRWATAVSATWGYEQDLRETLWVMSRVKSVFMMNDWGKKEKSVCFVSQIEIENLRKRNKENGKKDISSLLSLESE